MTGRPAVSIAIRAFRRRWLDAAISSVLDQTWRDLELVVYDDAGDLREAAERFGDPRLRYHRPSRKLAASGRFAAAVGLCRGEFIGLLDDDDVYEPSFVAELANALRREPGAGLAYCRTVFESGGRRFTRPEPAEEGLLPETLCEIVGRRRVITPSVMLMRRTAFEAAMSRQPMPADVNPDLFATARIAAEGWGVMKVDRALTVRRLHPGQTSAPSLAGSRREADTFAALDMSGGEPERLRRELLAACLARVALFELAAGDAASARRDLAAAQAATPRRTAARLCLAIAARTPVAGPLAGRAGTLVVKVRARRRAAGRPRFAGGRFVSRARAVSACRARPRSGSRRP